MANRKLNSIKFPDIADTYILDADKVNYDDSETYASGSVGKALQNKADNDGSYSNMTVGNAEQLVSNVKVNDKTPYLFRTSGGSVDIGDREYVNGIVGGTVAWNQLIENGNFQSTSSWNQPSGVDSWSVSNGIATINAKNMNDNTMLAKASFKFIENHIYLMSAEMKLDEAMQDMVSVFSSYPSMFSGYSHIASTTWAEYSTIRKATSSGSTTFFIGMRTYSPTGTFTYYMKNVMVFDLTQMFGSTIAEYILGLNQATAGAGMAWFKKLGFNKPYYAYNAGELKSVSGLVSHDMTGFNQWDEVWEVGTINWGSGDNNASSAYIRSKNYIPCLADTTYFIRVPNSKCNVFYYDENKNFITPKFINTGGQTFTTPSGCAFIRLSPYDTYGNAYKNDICINISWDGSRNGEYEPYELHSYPLDTDLTLRGIPKLDANNSLYYDGDVYEPSGEVTRKYKAVTIDGSNAFSYQYNGTLPSGYIACFINFADKAYGIYNMVSDKFERNNDESLLTMCGRTNNSGIQFTLPSTVTASNAGCKEWFTSNPTALVYELATPTTETADPYVGTQIVNDFGTEEYVIDSDTFAVPVGHDTDYPINLVAKLEMAPNSPEGNGDYIVRQVNGENSYVPLVIEDALPTIPSTAGSYKLTVTVAEGSDPVLSWESE